MDKTELPKTIIAARPSSSFRNGSKYCKNCYKQGHLLFECLTVQCRYCHKICHIVYNCPTKPPKPGHLGTLPRPGNLSVVAAAKESISAPSLSSVSVSELRLLVFSIVKQFMSISGKVSSVVSGNTWYFDSTCCNHMSPDSQLFSSVIPTIHALLIQTTNGSHISVSHTGSVSTPTLSFSDTYLIPNLILNLKSASQLCELGYDLWFRSSSCRVQDPQTNQVLGTGRRMGRMFELTSLHLPSTPTPSPSQHPPLAVDPVSLIRLLTSLLLLLLLTLRLRPNNLHRSVDPVTDQTPLLPSFVVLTGVRAPPAHLRDYSCFSAVLSLHEPHTYREACTNPLWQQAMTEELQALEKTHTWDLVDLPPVHQWPLFQMDVKNAFLNGDLTEEVYMQAPPAILCTSVWLLHPVPHDTALFIRRSDKGMILLLLYVDDMIITGDDHSGISDFKLFLHQQFEMKDLGHLSYFLGLEVSSDSTGYYLSQAKYASDLLSRAGLTDTKVGFYTHLR
uniref:Uncharacterized protein n=1 Tax=Fagus sylvatica TaxID=28930 RepID=A0A2N9GT15_FAGSY